MVRGLLFCRGKKEFGHVLETRGQHGVMRWEQEEIGSYKVLKAMCGRLSCFISDHPPSYFLSPLSLSLSFSLSRI
jgi:hypothetical protein